MRNIVGKKNQAPVHAKIILTFLLVVCQAQIGFTQGNFKTIVPLSPNAASLAKYGEIPVGNFTGIPSIGIPIYTVRSGELEMPISLSYHAGGNKVESVASWVGLGWSLSGIPSLSRSVVGLPDEAVGGFFSRYDGFTAREILDQHAVGNSQMFTKFYVDLYHETADSQPDVFAYNINGESGKFWYSQDFDKFITVPRSNIKIQRDGSNNYIIVAEDGTKYLFQDKESTNSTISGWAVSKIYNVNMTDSITFKYDIEQNSTRSFLQNVKRTFVSGTYCADVYLPNNYGVTAITNIQAQVPSEIRFNNGYLKFNRKEAEREDLVGGHALDEIQVLNSSNVMLKKLQFNVIYAQSGVGETGCVQNDTYKSNKWMFLSNVKEIDGQTVEAITHSFSYDLSNIPPCRNSFAQDYWGFYNGVTSNLDLIPTETIPGTTIQVPGANRAVNPNYSQFGILKKINYPTGGFTEFDYENNDGNNPGLPKIYVDQTAYIAAEGEENLPVSKEYTNTFTVNNPKDPILNNDNPNGGAFINVDIGAVGVPAGNVGAQLRFRGTSPGNSNINFNFSYSFQNYYVPNGTYELYAYFNQNPPNYQDFHYIVSWKTISAATSDSYIGGLRIKEIRSFDQSVTAPIVKMYKYKDSYNSTISSGDIFGNSNLNHGNLIGYSSASPNCSGTWFEQNSYSNQTQVTHSGSYVGYKKVFVQTNMPESTGVSSYDYTASKDASNTFLYAPVQSNESYRGQIKKSEDFRLVSGQLVLVKSTLYDYEDLTDDALPIFGVKLTATISNPHSGSNGMFVILGQPYELMPTWSQVSKKTETLYENSAIPLETVYEYEYNNPYKLLDFTKTTMSDNKIIAEKNYYPNSIILAGEEENARQWLLTHNSINTILRKESFTNNTLQSTTAMSYRNFNGNNLVKLYKLSQSYPSDVPRTTLFDNYDTKGRLRQQYLEFGPKTVYLWSYNHEYPIAEIKNSDYSSIAAVLGVNEIAEFANRTNPTKQAIDVFLAPLRSSLQNAFVTSYVHDPLVGMTSQTDQKGMTTYYNYDGFQRLSTVKDQNGNIIKSNTYHFKQ